MIISPYLRLSEFDWYVPPVPSLFFFFLSQDEMQTVVLREDETEFWGDDGELGATH